MGTRTGFTLLEVLISLVILGIGVIAVVQVFPPALSQARLSTERVTAAAWADEELSTLRARGLSDSPHSLSWPVRSTETVSTLMRESYLQYNLQCIGIPDFVRPMRQAAQIYYLYRVTLAVPMSDGRYETFVTYVSKQ